VWIVAFFSALLGTLFALSSASEVLKAESQPASPPPPAATSGTEEPPDALSFSVSNLRLRADSPETQCVMALGKNNLDECKRIAREALPTALEPSLGRLRYLLVRASQYDPQTARATLETLATTTHPLAAIAQLRLSELLRESDPKRALSLIETLLQDPRWKTRLEPLRAVLLIRVGRTVEAESLLRELVAQAPANSPAAPAAVTLATLLSNRSDLASKKEALALYRRVYTRTPTSPTGEQARGLTRQLLASLPAAERTANALSFADAVTEAEAFLSSRAYDRAARAFIGLAARKDPEEVCVARLGQGRALMSMRKPGEAAGVLARVIEGCQSPEVRAGAHFQLGRAVVRQGDPTRAIGHYEAAAKLAPELRVADDALIAASQAYLDLGDATGAKRVLAQLLDHPNAPDTRANARFGLGWLERQGGNFVSALAQFSQLTAEGPNETSEDLFGRSAYWHARTLLDSGQREAASAEFMELFRSRPLTYYSQQAVARLQEIDPRAVDTLLEELRDTDPKVGLWMSIQPELRAAEFERAVELLRVGEPSRALDELTALGTFDKKASDALYLTGAALLQEFGAPAQATTFARRRVGAIMRTQPKGETRAMWRVVFPQAYSPLIDNVARNAGLPPAFVRAIAREESSFDPNAVSTAKAYGLIQVISSTAKAYARPLRLPHDPRSLKNPEVNLRIGTSFMRDLFERYDNNHALVPAAYNAGNGACDRWLRERPTLALDEWIELIPYFETRRYTRRVLQTYGVYNWLDEGKLPGLRSGLPGASAGPAPIETAKLLGSQPAAANPISP
jgi:soluble lytic murein transglycosylase